MLDEFVSAAIFGIAQAAVLALVFDSVVVLALWFVSASVLFASVLSLVYVLPALVFGSAIEFVFRVLVAIWIRTIGFRP